MYQAKSIMDKILEKMVGKKSKIMFYKCVGRVVTIWSGSWYLKDMWMNNLCSYSLKWVVDFVWWYGVVNYKCYFTFKMRLKSKTTCGRDFVFYSETPTLGLVQGQLGNGLQGKVMEIMLLLSNRLQFRHTPSRPVCSTGSSSAHNSRNCTAWLCPRHHTNSGLEQSSHWAAWFPL